MSSQGPLGFALSPQQKHLWLLTQAVGARPFGARVALAVEGEVAAEDLERALREMVGRHEILRTRFTVPAGMSLPLQVIPEEGAPELSWHDLSEADPEAAEAELDRLWSAAATAELPEGPPLRVEAAVLAPDRYRLVISLPALCADSAGLDNVVAELARSLGIGGDEPADEPLQYADLAEWQNDVFASADGEAGRELWRRRARDLPAAGALPFGPADGRDFAPVARGLSIDPADAVESLARRWGAPPSNVWLACWQAVLGRLSGDGESAVGVVLSGRHYPDLEPVPGLFARSLPLAVTLDPEAGMEAHLAGLAASLAEMEKWQECFSWDDLRTGGEGSPRRFLPAGFEDRPPLPAFRNGGGSLRVLARDACFDRSTVKLETGSEGPRLVYDGSALSPEAADRLAEQLEVLVADLAARPEAPAGELRMLGPLQTRAMADLNPAPGSRGATATFLERFREQAARHGGGTALVFEEQEVSWTDLDRRAGRLAARLARSGVGRETPVALVFDRTPELVVALLGVLEAGGFYVPLDPQQPRERLAAILERLEPRAVLTAGGLGDGLALPGVPVLRLDEEGGPDATGPPERGFPPPDPRQLMYVVFTSGSTGVPKGVAVEHRQVASYLDSIVPRIEAEPGLHYAWVSTPAADLGNTVLLTSLATGGCLHLVRQERAGSAEAFADYVEARGVDVVKIVPSHLRALLAVDRPERAIPRRTLVLGGEACPWDLVARVRALRPECRVINHYGPTETTVGVLSSESPEEPSGPGTGAPIGRPFDGTRVHLADAGLQPVPWGSVGGLLVGGDQLARGYRDMPAATAAAFLPDPFGDEPGGRLYRTGDLARLGPDGQLSFAGRSDHQVKVRGYRVEPGEVEAVLRRHPEVREAAVVARDDGPSGPRLVAYVAAGSGDPASAELRDWLRERLPEAMVPSAIVLLEALPLTANGKLDRARLPAPEEARQAAVHVPPDGPVEEALAAVWEEVFGVERIGSEDNFFDLGGDSILAIRIVGEAARQGIRLVPRQLFELQTVARLAAAAGRVEASRATQGPVTGPAPLTPIQHAFFEQAPADPHHHNQHLLLELGTPMRPSVLAAGVAAVLAHHDALRLRFRREVGGWRQEAAGSAPSAVLEIDLGAVPPARRDGAVERAAASVQRSLDLERGPLLRVVQFVRGDEAADLLLVAHHLVMDAVSWRLLLEDLQQACEAVGEERPVALPPKTTSYKEWAERLVRHAGSDDLAAEAAYWLDPVRGEAHPLPAGDPEGENLEGASRIVDAYLDEEATTALLQKVARSYGVSIQAVLLAALVEAFAEWTGRRVLRIDLEGHGREEDAAGSDLSRTVGWFTSIFPQVVDLRGAPFPGAALRAVDEQLRAVPRAGVGYGVLRYLAGGEVAERLASQPPAEMSFNYLGQLDRVLASTSDLRLAAIPAGPPRSPRAARRYLLQVVGRVEAGRLRVSWRYPAEIYGEATIAAVADRYLEALRAAIAARPEGEPEGYAPADVAEVQLDAEELDTLLEQIGGQT